MYDVYVSFFFFFFQAEDGIRDLTVTGVQTCALPICGSGCSRTRRISSRWRRRRACPGTRRRCACEPATHDDSSVRSPVHPSCPAARREPAPLAARARHLGGRDGGRGGGGPRPPLARAARPPGAQAHRRGGPPPRPPPWAPVPAA